MIDRCFHWIKKKGMHRSRSERSFCLLALLKQLFLINELSNKVMNQKVKEEKKEMNTIKVPQFELFQLRALCDEIMHSLCQAKALLEPVSEEDFFQRLEVEVLRHYFYALDTIIDSALGAKDRAVMVLDAWGKEEEVIEK